jgi:hypothetical protein
MFNITQYKYEEMTRDHQLIVVLDAILDQLCKQKI